jgi:hypothetical protein
MTKCYAKINFRWWETMVAKSCVLLWKFTCNSNCYCNLTNLNLRILIKCFVWNKIPVFHPISLLIPVSHLLGSVAPRGFTKISLDSANYLMVRLDHYGWVYDRLGQCFSTWVQQEYFWGSAKYVIICI